MYGYHKLKHQCYNRELFLRHWRIQIQLHSLRFPIRGQLRPQAEKQVKIRLALEKIASLENLDATEEEINEEYTKIGAAYGVEVDEVKKMIAVEDIKADLLTAKAMELVKANAVSK